MPSSASSSSSSSLYIIGARAPDAALDGGDTDDDASGGGALSRPVAERFASSFLTQESLDALCRKYGVPDQFKAILPAGHHRACSPPPPGAVCVYAQALEAGMRVPLHGFFCEVLAHFGVAPSQIAPNGWRVMAGFLVLCHFAGVPPSLAVFRHFFSLCAHKLKGWYWFRGKDSAGALIKGLPLSLKGWKEGFFFLRSPTPWPCPVKWGEPSKVSTAEPVLTREEQIRATKLLRVHGAAVDLKTCLSESNLAAAMATGSPRPPPPPPSPRTASTAKGMDPSVYDMMKSLRAAKAAQALGEKVTAKSEPGSDTPLSGTKRKLADDATKQGLPRHEPSTPLDHAHGSSSGAAPPGFSTQRASKSSVRDHDPVPKPRHTPDLPDGGDTAGWEAARRMLQSIVAPSRERAFSAAKPSDVIESSFVTMLEAANCVSFSLGYALELEEKLAAREREADALRRELTEAKAELAGARKASAGEARSARAAALEEYLGSTEHMLRQAKHALAGYERGMEHMKRAALRRYPHLDPEQLVVPPDGGGP
ncbi:hypothetical protein GQ55_4G321200 [Panicum hallii var. hallii]|uniref:Transposase (putative) gypsy type domain-containing protein n=1 Tax=Panicum hallii var. hallii TaxID=1504633 RepID=A0A2T7E298_9POAL|nr:hypothetical protein GQ55_4G321200 [Panicum hallii var. hallii]